MEEERLKNKNLIKAFQNASNGIWYAIKTQRNVQIQLVITILVLIACLLFRLTITEYLFIIFACFFVLVTEVINTAIETAVNLCTKELHPLAKIAKDVAAGAVVLAVLNSVIIAGILFFSKL